MTHDPWSVNEGKIDRALAIVRVREMLPRNVSANSHPRLLKITWAYGSCNSNGMPGEQDSREMGEFEEQIVPPLERESLCALFAVVTHDGKRDWKFYCRDTECAQNVIFEVLGLSGSLPIELEAEDDPAWKEYQELLVDTHRKQSS